MQVILEVSKFVRSGDGGTRSVKYMKSEKKEEKNTMIYSSIYTYMCMQLFYELCVHIPGTSGAMYTCVDFC